MTMQTVTWREALTISKKLSLPDQLRLISELSLQVYKNLAKVKPGAKSYDISLTQIEDNGYVAQVLAWPDCVVQAATREEAIAQAKTVILERLANTEIVTIELDLDKVNHPWLPFAGTWTDDPRIDEFEADLEWYRRELDAEYEASETTA